ncbi:MAG: hypothetical protein ABGY95_06345 [Rubritalea sp.]|uniref:hypothetical protein n=1 Tax=Rubritalea sp. TaxID=2109375 RepID=UPI003242C617
MQKIQPAKWVKETNTPLFFAHGTDDTLLSMQRVYPLFQQAGSTNKKWSEVEGASHSNILVTPMPHFSEMAAWLLEHPSS